MKKDAAACSFKIGPCRDRLGLWYVERRNGSVCQRRYFSYRHTARDVVKLLRDGKLNFDLDTDFERFV
jgi:hypothetical protein